MIDKELIIIVKGFVKGMLNKKSTVDQCFVVCSPLASYLSLCGIECTLTEGEVNEFHHYWITLKDGRIIDPTADQFGLPNLYVVNQPFYYKQYTAKDYNREINAALERFQNTFVKQLRRE